ncbi:MAG TPA: hypothetical protein VIU87_16455, partial [Mycobacterium sp.]
MTRIWFTALMIAVLAAAVEGLGSWADFASAGVRNLLVAGAVVLLTGGARTPAPSKPVPDSPASPDTDRSAAGPTADSLMEMVRREVGELTTLADHLYGMADLARHEPELGEETFVRLDDLRWLLGSYVIKGGRIRRLAQLPDLLASCDVRCRPEHTIDVVRVAAADLLQRINDTNTVTVDWLLAHRVALPDPNHLDSNALLGRYHRLDVEPMSISGDPLYLLTCHIHDILETVECVGDVEHPVLEVLETQLARVLTSVEDEITSAQALNTALISLARDMRSADAA